MIEGFITAIAVILLSFVIGMLIGSNKEVKLEKEIYKLKLENEVLIDHLSKVNDVLRLIKDDDTTVDLTHDGVIVMYANDDFDYRDFFEGCFK